MKRGKRNLVDFGLIRLNCKEYENFFYISDCARPSMKTTISDVDVVINTMYVITYYIAFDVVREWYEAAVFRNSCRWNITVHAISTLIIICYIQITTICALL